MTAFLIHCLALLAALAPFAAPVSATADQSLPADRAEKLPEFAHSRRPAVSFGVVRSNWRIRMGDDVHWAQPTWDDSDWERIDSMFDTPARAGIFWLRFHVRSPNPANRTPTGAWISGTIAYDLYWDGALMVRNGVPGNRLEDEVPGRLDVLPTFPEEATGPGEHVVAMRLSSYRCGFPADKAEFFFFMNDPVVVRTWDMRNALFPTLSAGAMFILTVVCAFIWFFAARRAALLCVGSMTLCGATMEALTALRWFYNYPSDWHYPLTIAHNCIYGAFAWCFVAFVIANFAVPYGRWILVALVPLLRLGFEINVTPAVSQSPAVIAAAYGVAIGPLIWAAGHRRPGAWPVIIGIVASAAWILSDPYVYTWMGFFPRFLPALFGVTAAIALQIREERREAQQTRLTAARLEIELLKKSLQPHFLLNTLTALMEVIEQSPAMAVKLIDDLAREFRMLSAMSAEKTVPLIREIELCRAHLRVMSIHLGRDCRLDMEGVDEAARVPPALFLTLIENGFSHQRPANGPIVFELRYATSRARRFRYTFVSPGTAITNGTQPSGGTGLRYIRARLEEGSPGRWMFEDRSTPQGWETVVEIEPPPPGPPA